jgi:hypothetical protein
VFFNWFDNLPDAFHAFGEDDHVTLFDGNRLLAFGCNDRAAFDYVAGFLLVIFPVEFRNTFTPYGPVIDVVVIAIVDY